MKIKNSEIENFIENRVFNLHNSELDKDWRTWIRAYGKNLHKNLREFLKNYNLQKFAKDFSISYKMIKDWKSGRSGIPLWFLMELKGRFSKDFTKDIEFLGTYRATEKSRYLESMKD